MASVSAVGLAAIAACGGTAGSVPSAATSAPAAPKPTSAPAAAASAAPGASPAASPGASPAAKPAASPSAAAAAASPSAVAGPVAAADDPNLVNAAKSEGKGTLYFSIDPTAVGMVLDAFNAKYSIQVDSQRLTSGPLAQRFTAEEQANNIVADVLINSDTSFMDDATSKGWITKIDSLPQLASWPKEYVHDSYVTVAIVPSSLLWNTSQVNAADAPKGWQDVLDPKWKGKLILLDPHGAPPVLEFLYLMRQTYGDDFLRKLGAQQPQLVASAVTASQQVAAGAAAIEIPAVHATLLPLIAQNAPIQEGFFTPTTGANSQAALVAKAPHPNVAKLLLNFFMSPQGQGILNKDAWSPVPGTPGTRPQIQTSPPLTAQAVAQQDEIISLLGL
jgi:iron(III) transport system substrate-binding protein